jgi:hypothetical protein
LPLRSGFKVWAGGNRAGFFGVGQFVFFLNIHTLWFCASDSTFPILMQEQVKKVYKKVNLLSLCYSKSIKHLTQHFVWPIELFLIHRTNQRIQRTTKQCNDFNKVLGMLKSVQFNKCQCLPVWPHADAGVMCKKG